MKCRSVSKRVLSFLCTLALIVTMIPLVGASLVPSSQYWTELDAVSARQIARSTEDCIIVFYSNRCGYSQKWVPQFYDYINHNKIPVYGIDYIECGNVLNAGGTFPMVAVRKNGKLTTHNAVHSLTDFHNIVNGSPKETVGTFEILGGVLSAYTGTDSSISIPDGVYTIADKCFMNNEALVSVTIPEGIVSIGSYAFYNCPNLSKLEFPSTLTRIDSVALMGCYSLSRIRFHGSKPTVSGSLTFDDVDILFPANDPTWSNLDELQEQAPYANWVPIPTRSDIDDGTLSDWAASLVSEAVGYGLVPDAFTAAGNYNAPTTRRDFCSLVMQLIEVKTGMTAARIAARITESPFTDVPKQGNDAILAAHSLDLISGRGNGIFDPNGTITRQEAAVMLRATGKYLNLRSSGTPKTFSDASGIADWAAESVDYVTALGIMSGTDRGFEPLGSYSYEQAYCTFLALYKKLPSSWW